MSPPRIEPAQAEDAAQIAACARAAFAEYVAAINREPAPMTADYPSLISQGAAHAAWRDGALIGFCIAYPNGAALHVETVAVAPEARGAGLGGALIAFCEARARAQGLAAVELYTNAAMTAARAWYPRLGYDVIDRRRDAGFDRIFFRKTL